MKIIAPKRLDKFALMIEYSKYRNKGMKLQQCKLDIGGNGSRVGGLIDNILHVMAFVCSNYGVTTHLLNMCLIKIYFFLDVFIHTMWNT